MAVALVAGQAALCAVIGWLTFGPSESAPQAAAVKPLTAPIVVPTASIGMPPVLPAPAPPSSSASAKTKPVKSSKPAVAHTTATSVVEERPRTVIDPAKSPAASATPQPDLQMTPPPSPIDDDVQEPVVKGRSCSPEGAKGKTADGDDLRCEKDDDGELVWQIN